MGWPTGFEPATTSSTSLDSTIELRPPTDRQARFMRAQSQVRWQGKTGKSLCKSCKNRTTETFYFLHCSTFLVANSTAYELAN